MWPKNRIFFLAFLLFLPFIFGFIFPDTFWGTHFAVFLAEPWNYIFISLSGLYIFYNMFFQELKIPRISSSILKSTFFAILIGLFLGAILYHFPIDSDYYGNARSFIPFLNEKVENLDDQFLSSLFTFAFEPGYGRRGVFKVYTLFAYWTGLTYAEIFRWAGAVCGGTFTMLWISVVSKQIQNTCIATTLILAGMLTPFMLIFAGHIDTYAILYLLVFVWILLLKTQIERYSSLLLIPLFIVLLVNIRFHTLNYLLVPGFVFAILHQYKREHILYKRISNLNGLLSWTFVPFLILILVLYFFVFKDYNDPRTLTEFTDIERLFLPINSPEPPLDKYNLLSWNHILDFINMFFFWAVVMLFILSSLVIYRWKVISKSNQFVNIAVLISLCFVTTLFMFNPLLSMPIDWDVFVFPAPFLLVILLSLFEKLGEHHTDSSILGGSLALSFICIPVFITCHINSSHSHRIESVAIRVYNTYYAHADTYLLYALQMIKDDPKLYMERKRNVLEKLKPKAVLGNDPKYAALLTDDAIYKYKVYEDYNAARNDFKLALDYNPKAYINMFYLFEIDVSEMKYNSAYAYAKNLLEVKYPNHKSSLRNVIECAIELGKYEDVLVYCKHYLEVFSGDTKIQGLYDTLNQDQILEIEELRAIFRENKQ